MIQIFDHDASASAGTNKRGSMRKPHTFRLDNTILDSRQQHGHRPRQSTKAYRHIYPPDEFLDGLT